MKTYFDWKSMSPMRRRYTLRLAGRILILIACLVCALAAPWEFDILHGWNFFKQFSLLHLLWLVWMMDMLAQILPGAKDIPLGSQKLFKDRFKPLKEKINRQSLAAYTKNTARNAGLIMLLWIGLIAVICILRIAGILDDTALFLITALFFVCDLICVLIWCPFRLILKTRCCTTCRIFNWDHLMMFSPMLLVKGFYSWSLLLTSIIALLVWEINVLLHPERFWEYSNAALLCANCTDKLCTQYCRKLR